MSAALDLLRGVTSLRGAGDALEALAAAATRRDFDAAELLVPEHADDDGLYVVGDGAVQVYERRDGALVARECVDAFGLFAGPRALVGELRVAKAVGERGGWLLRIPRATLEDAAERDDGLFNALTVLTHEALRRNLLRALLPRVFGALDEALLDECERRFGWTSLRRGEALFRQGDPADAWYVVARGRLQVHALDPDGTDRVLDEVGRGETIGDAALLTGVPRSATVTALRDTELMCLQRADLDALVARHPPVALGVARSLLQRLLQRNRRAREHAQRTFICVVPARTGVLVGALTKALVQGLERYGPALHLTSPPGEERQSFAHLPHLPEDHPSWVRFVAWLDERSTGYRFVVLEADPLPTAWTERCVREADEVLLVADATGDATPSQMEAEFIEARAKEGLRVRLVLQHPANTARPHGTAAWLDARTVHRHAHVRLGDEASTERLARAVAGESVCLVLGAGGARGFAHVGVLRALGEAGIPVDTIGGASIGALVAGLHGMGVTPTEMLERGRQVAKMRPFGDYALPITSVLRGRRAERAAAMLFGDTRIEDLWIPYFCNSCDISYFRNVVHERGSLADAVLASSALPGVMPPQVRDGCLHVDGGTTDMLPGTLMRARHRGPMIAVDVSTERQLSYPLAKYPTSWQALWHRMRRREPLTPSLPELFLRAACLGVAQGVDAVARDADLFLRPPVERYGTVELSAIEDIEVIGYTYAVSELRAFRWGPAAQATPGGD